MDSILIIGTIGMFMILLAFALNLFKIIHQDTKTYNLINLFGAGMLLYYSIIVGSIPFILLQVIWGLFALYKLVLIIVK